MPKNQLENFVQYGQLFEVYGGLLSEDRQQIMNAYFRYNMTIAEIADERAVSRQAIFDALQKSCEKLQNLEKELCIIAKRRFVEGSLQKIMQEFPQTKSKVEEILKGL